MTRRGVEEPAELVFVPATLLRGGAVTRRVHQPGDVAVHETGALRVAERGAQDLMHVHHGFGCERTAVVASAAAEVGVEVFEVGDRQAAQRHATDVR